MVGLASRMQLLNEGNMGEIMRSNYILDEFDKGALESTISDICNPAKVNVVLRSKSFESATTQVEQWYQTKYHVEPIPNSLQNKMMSPSVRGNLSHPPSNDLVPTDFSVLPKKESLSGSPSLIKQWPNTELWYLKDDQFLRPKCRVSMKIYTNDNNLGSSPHAAVFGSVWSRVVGEVLREYNYMASCANLSMQVQCLHDNLHLEWNGFNHTIPTYISSTLNQITNLDQNELEAIFNEVKDKLLVDLANTAFDQSYQQAFTVFDNAAVNASLPPSQLKDVLERYSFDQFREHSDKWLTKGRQTWFVSGNFDDQKAVELVEEASQTLKLRDIMPEELA